MPEIINNNRPTYEDRRRKGTGFTNTKDLVDANVGNKVGQTVASGIQKDVENVTDNVDKQYDKFKQDSDDNRLLWNNDNKSDNQKSAEGFISNIKSGQFNLTDEKTQPEKDLYNQQQNKMKGYFKGNYSGPTEMTNTDQLQYKAKSLEALGKMGRGEQGRQQILNRTFGDNNYTAGQARLDSMLMGKSKEGQNAIKDITSKTRDLSESIANKQAFSRNIGRERQVEARDFGSKFGDAIRQQQDSIGTELEQRVQTGTGSLAGILQQEYAKTGKVDPRILKMLGVQDGRLYGTDLSQFTGPEANIKTVANEGDVARLGALGQIMGESTNPILTGDLSSVGTYSELSNDKLRDEILARKQQESDVFSNLSRYGITERNDSLIDDYARFRNTYNDGGGMLNPYRNSNYNIDSKYDTGSLWNEGQKEQYDSYNNIASGVAPSYKDMNERNSQDYQNRRSASGNQFLDLYRTLDNYKSNDSVYGQSSYLSELESKQKEQTIADLISKFGTGSIANLGE